MRRLAVLWAALALLIPAGCADPEEPDAASEGGATGSVDAFYEVPKDIDEFEPGELIRHAEAKKLANGVVHRVMYASESLEGDPIAVTGLVAIPSADAPAGGRPVLGYAHWTTGLADECAPSRTLDGATLGILDASMRRGMVVAATDYEGLGTPGLHPYLVGESEGRGVLDAIRAAKRFPGAEANDSAVIWGHSQGGHAALFAAQLAAEWAPEIDLRGAAAGAPPSEFQALSETVGDSRNLGYLAMIAAGINAANPDARLEDILTADGIDLLRVAEKDCTAAVLQAFSGKSAADVVTADPVSVPPWKEAIASTDPGYVKTDVPLLIFHGADDELVPAQGSEVLFNRLCGLGQNVERKLYPGQNHGGVVLVALPDVTAWLDARLAGTPTAGNCPARVSG